MSHRPDLQNIEDVVDGAPDDRAPADTPTHAALVEARATATPGPCRFSDAQLDAARANAESHNKGLGDGQHCWHGLAGDVIALVDEVRRLADALAARDAAHRAEVERASCCICGVVHAPPPDPRAAADRASVGGRILDRSLADFTRSCEVHIAEEQRKAAPDNAVIALLCDAVRLAREHEDRARRSLLAPVRASEPPDAVARAAAAERVVRAALAWDEQAPSKRTDAVVDELHAAVAALRAMREGT